MCNGTNQSFQTSSAWDESHSGATCISGSLRLPKNSDPSGLLLPKNSEPRALLPRNSDPIALRLNPLGRYLLVIRFPDKRIAPSPRFLGATITSDKLIRVCRMQWHTPGSALHCCSIQSICICSWSSVYREIQSPYVVPASLASEHLSCKIPSGFRRYPSR